MGKYNDGWFTNLVDLFETGVEKFRNNRLFGVKNPEGDYEWMSYGEIGERVANFRGGLASLGVGKGDLVGGIFGNCPEYAVTCFATYGLGASWVPMYLKELTQTWKYIINDSKMKVLIVNDEEVYEKIMSFKDECPNLEHVYVIETEREESFAALEKIGQEKPIDSIKPSPDDIAVIIYTSGTTGDPKGVMLSHKNITSNAQAGYNLFHDELTEDTVAFSILPWAHSYAYTAELNNWFQFGGSIGLMDDITTLIDDLPKVAPTILMAVPRVFNMIHAGIHRKMEEEGGLKLKLFHKALELAKEKRETGKAGFMYKLLYAMVIKKIQGKFGGRLTTSLTASAAMNVEIAKFFIDIGINCYDAYGLTETSPAVTMNTPKDWRLGSVGKPVEKVTVKIDKERVSEESDDGEIIVYGPNVMQGYLNKPEKTKEVMTPDGGFRTGDRGRIDEDGFLFITGRFKEEYKLENGKYVHPAGIEEDMKLLPYIANAFVYGDGKRYNVALVVPDFDVIREMTEKLNIQSADDFSEFIKSKEVRKLLRQEIKAHLAKKYGGYEIPKRYWYLTEDFTVDNGILTQTLKLKRRKVMEKYGEIIDYLYEKGIPEE